MPLLTIDLIGRRYSDEVIPLSNARTTTGPSYHPAVKALLAALAEVKGLPRDVRIVTSEGRSGGGTDQPDLAIYEGGGKAPVADRLPSVALLALIFRRRLPTMRTQGAWSDGQGEPR